MPENLINNGNTAVLCENKLLFTHLPGYAHYVRTQCLLPYVEETLRLSREMDLPLLKFINGMPDEELIAMSLKSNEEILILTEENRLNEHLEKSLKQWVEDRLGIMRRDEITTEDINLAGYIRKKALLKFLPSYTSDVREAIEIIKEIDTYSAETDTVFTNVYITLLKERLSESEYWNKQAQELAHIGNWTWDLKTGKIEWSDILYDIYGIAPGTELAFEDILVFNSPGEDIKIKNKLKELLKNNISNETYYNITLTDGTQKILHAKSEVFKDQSGNQYKMIGIIQDVTAQKNAERALFNKNVELQQSNTSLEEFAYVASHDLKEPLRKISTFSDRLLTGQNNQNLDENSKLYLNKIIDESKRMQKMISDLLSVSTISGNKSFEKCDLNYILNEAIKSLEQKIEETNAKIETDKIPVVSIVPSQFLQLFQNLINNSLKFARKEVPCHIKITHSIIDGQHKEGFGSVKSNKYLEMCYEDNGIGFDNQYADKIFTIFQRLNGRAEYEGTGIGLAICRKIVENHGGTISANGKPGQGAVFTIAIPV